MSTTPERARLARAARAPARADAPRRAPARPPARAAARRAPTRARWSASSARSSGGGAGRAPPRGACPARSTTRRSCRSAPAARTCSPRSATTRSSSSRARPARARRPSCRSSASSSGRGVRGDDRATPSRAGSPRAPSPSGSPTSCDVPLGEAVGYAVRFNDRSREDTLVRLMTDGLLLAEIQRDRLLRRYDTIIVDEAHERSLNIDFLLGYLHADPAAAARPEADHHLGDDRPRALRRALRRRAGRRGLRPHVPGRGPLPARGARRRGRPTPVDAIGDAVDELLREGPGDVLVFLSGEREIRDTAEALSGRLATDVEVLPLYARLSRRRAAARLPAARRAAASCSPRTSPRPR